MRTSATSIKQPVPPALNSITAANPLQLLQSDKTIQDPLWVAQQHQALSPGFNPLQLLLRPSAGGEAVLQRKGTVEGLLKSVFIYVDQLERYSHQGYELYGKRTLGDAEASRQIALSKYQALSPVEIQKLKSKDFNWEEVEGDSARFSSDLVYFHATHLHLKPVDSVSYRGDVADYHQKHLATKLKDTGIGKNRNYATLYYSITIQFNMAGKPYNLVYSGSYAGRSGKYDCSHTIKAPAAASFGDHQVASTGYTTQHYEYFTDHHLRDYDSEVAIFETLTATVADDLKKRGIPHYQSSGQVNLFSDRATCNSCTAMAMQFKDRWKVKVNLIHGGVDDGKGYNQPEADEATPME